VPPTSLVRAAWCLQGEAHFEIKVNVLSSMRHSRLFRFCVFPVDVVQCQEYPNLSATTRAVRTLCKKPRPDKPSVAAGDTLDDADDEVLAERAQAQADKITELARENEALLNELSKLRAFMKKPPTTAIATPAKVPSISSPVVHRREAKRPR